MQKWLSWCSIPFVNWLNWLPKKVTGKSFIGNSHNITTKKTQYSGKKGFEILQNIQDRDKLQKHVRCAGDPISMVTVSKKPDEKKNF
jgi:hypothetical protein